MQVAFREAVSLGAVSERSGMFFKTACAVARVVRRDGGPEPSRSLSPGIAVHLRLLSNCGSSQVRMKDRLLPASPHLGGFSLEPSTAGLRP